MKIKRTLRIPAAIPDAFEYFVTELHAWWPREYTWSGDKLKMIMIEPFENGHCTETGPYDFRIDWGRVITFEQNRRMVFKWQIGADCVPEPDPDKASEVMVSFSGGEGGGTVLDFVHKDFEKHGEDALTYMEAMDSENGWDYILVLYLDHCKNKVPA